MCTVKKITEALVVASKEIGLAVNAEKTKYMVMSRNQHAGKITTEGKIINPLRGWNSSHVWKQP
jgi:hypothetical protein